MRGAIALFITYAETDYTETEQVILIGYRQPSRTPSVSADSRASASRSRTPPLWPRSLSARRGHQRHRHPDPHRGPRQSDVAISSGRRRRNRSPVVTLVMTWPRAWFRVVGRFAFFGLAFLPRLGLRRRRECDRHATPVRTDLKNARIRPVDSTSAPTNFPDGRRDHRQILL